MFTKSLDFLEEMGFTNIQLDIYNYLLIHKFGTIKDIKEDLNYSYAQVHHNLRILEEYDLIESSEDLNPKLYYRKNPKLALKELINLKYSKINDRIEKLDEEIKIQDSTQGVCSKYTSFYHYSDIKLGIEYFFEMIEKAEKEVIINAIPLPLLKNFEPALNEAFKKGIHLDLYFSKDDFINETNYLKEATEILRRVGITITETTNRTSMNVWYDENEAYICNIMIDEYWFNSIVFREEKILHIEGFPSPNLAKNQKGYLQINPVIKTMEMKYPEAYKEVLNVIKSYKSIKTRDLSKKSKIGGTILREILDFFVNENLIVEESIKQEGPGRPKKVYSVVE